MANQADANRYLTGYLDQHYFELPEDVTSGMVWIPIMNRFQISTIY